MDSLRKYCILQIKCFSNILGLVYPLRILRSDASKQAADQPLHQRARHAATNVPQLLADHFSVVVPT